MADGHLKDAPLESVYSGVVSIRGIRLVIFMAKLNDLEVHAADIGNAYLEAYMKEKVCFIADEGFGNLQGHMFIIRKALYSLKTSRKIWSE